MQIDISYTCPHEAEGQRIDAALAVAYPEHSRSAIARAVESGSIVVNGAATRPKYRLSAGDVVSGVLAVAGDAALVPDSSLPITIVAETDDYVVISKPAGVVTHPSTGSQSGSVAHWLLSHSPDAAAVGDDVLRPGIVHRLDRDTSGVMVLCKNQSMFEHLKKQFSERRVTKKYTALVFGHPDPVMTIHAYIGRSHSNPRKMSVLPKSDETRDALTKMTLQERYTNPFPCSLVTAFPKTGRTHQIRVHLQHAGFPVVGDAVYSRKEYLRDLDSTLLPLRHLLHASELSFCDRSGTLQTFSAPLADDFSAFLGHCS